METIETHCFRICARVPEGTPHLKIAYLADRASGGHAAFVAPEQTQRRRQSGVFGLCAIVADSTQALRTADSIPLEHRDASRQAALHGRADQPGSKKGERDSRRR